MLEPYLFQGCLPLIFVFIAYSGLDSSLQKSRYQRGNKELLPKLFPLIAPATGAGCQGTKSLGPGNIPYHYPKWWWDLVGVSYTRAAQLLHVSFPLNFCIVRELQ